ncbi:MAG: hypothetical protein ACI4I4_06290 [Acutalibacteraceae bacterium]
MKKLSAFLCILLIVCSLTACKNGAENTEQNEKESIAELTGFSLENFNIETDDQSFFGYYHQMASTENGYYYFGGDWGDFLYYFDKESKQAVPLCNKPDCEHNQNYPDCNAYFDNIQYERYYGIFYYNSSLYLLGGDGEYNCTGLYLYKISSDGTKRECVRLLRDFGSEFRSMKIEFMMHKGKGYFVYSSDSKTELYSFDIEDKNSELVKIDEAEGAYPEFYRLIGCEDGISYQYFGYKDKDMKNFSGGIKIYLPGNKPEMVVKDAVKPYTIANGNIYYETADGLKMYSLKTKTVSDVETKNNANSPNYDGNYFYLYDVTLDNEYTIYIYDKDMKFIDSVKAPGSLYFGDENYFFGCYDEDPDNLEEYTLITCYFDKSKIGKEELKWKRIE